MDEILFSMAALLAYIGWAILGAVITIATLGICYPWALTMLYGWKINHTVIEGHRIAFLRFRCRFIWQLD
ncbi:membrane protein [Lacticaseibacillus rhamnosus MTCC 5462]|nr:membrane protein [Lacticaseibacillus rhamnosus MTCC 5462]